MIFRTSENVGFTDNIENTQVLISHALKRIFLEQIHM